jgi:[ribosomal protein S18]-alanine N-acetyltransferase
MIPDSGFRRESGLPPSISAAEAARMQMVASNCRDLQEGCQGVQARGMIVDCEIRLAQPRDALAIATMSRDLVENGLGWRWNASRVLGSIRDPAANVAVAVDGANLLGFGIMKYRELEAHLYLLAVLPQRQRNGIGAALVNWLEDSALVAGIGVVYLEARATNEQARAFYQRLGYKEFNTMPRYYRGVEDGVRLAKDLW